MSGAVAALLIALGAAMPHISPAGADSLALEGFRLYATDPREAAAMIERAATLGSARAANNLGYLLLQGEVYDYDPAKAAYWLSRADRAGIPEATAQLADLYRTGSGVEADTLRARELYNKAIREGFTQAARPLISMDAPALRRQSADSLARLAAAYYPAPAPGLGVAIARIAAEEHREHMGSAMGEILFMLSDAYATGRGAPYDYDLSLRLLKEAAALGHVEAAERLAEQREFFPDL